ncbi:MAG: hypothetical protein IPP79_09205 [Chitinophagaceae bacterium]|nr:hypothetical protein [Chitinophagaceae bacterium]
MRNRIVKFCLLAAVVAMCTQVADAQTKKPTRAKSKKTVTKNNNSKNPALTPPVVKDTVPAVVVPEADLKIEAPRPSLRNDYAFEHNLVKERTPLAYEHIREDDATYVQRVWREIDVHEKMNVPFNYKAEGDQGNQRFIMILLGAIKKGEITAFSAAGGDDRFTTPMQFKEIAELLVGKPQVKQVPDWKADPDGSKGLQKILSSHKSLMQMMLLNAIG